MSVENDWKADETEEMGTWINRGLYDCGTSKENQLASY